VTQDYLDIERDMEEHGHHHAAGGDRYER